jgi:hypothetical protein
MGYNCTLTCTHSRHHQVLRLYPRVKHPLTFVPSRFIICLLEAPSGAQPSCAHGAEGAPRDGSCMCYPLVSLATITLSHPARIARYAHPVSPPLVSLATLTLSHPLVSLATLTPSHLLVSLVTRTVISTCMDTVTSITCTVLGTVLCTVLSTVLRTAMMQLLFVLQTESTLTVLYCTVLITVLLTVLLTRPLIVLYFCAYCRRNPNSLSHQHCMDCPVPITCPLPVHCAVLISVLSAADHHAVLAHCISHVRVLTLSHSLYYTHCRPSRSPISGAKGVQSFCTPRIQPTRRRL